MSLPIRSAFAKADNVLSTAAKSIAEIITVTSEVNVDFEDVKTVMKDSGAAVMGSAITEGENRALRAAEEALSSPLLNNTDIHGAQKILLSIMSGDQAELEMDELTEITEFIQDKAGEEAEVIFGHGIDPELGQSIRVTVIATGFAREGNSIVNIPAIKKIMDSAVEKPVQAEIIQPAVQVMEPVAAPITAPVYQAPVSAPVLTQEPVRMAQPQVQPAPQPTHQPQQPQQSGFPTQQLGLQPEPANMPMPEPTPRLVYELGVNQEVFAHDMPAGHPKPQVAPAIPVIEIFDEKDNLANMENEAVKRRERLRRLSSEISNDAIKEKLEVPAYMRRNVSLENVVHSSERNISRFSLNDDNEILGDNRFLHDNVD